MRRSGLWHPRLMAILTAAGHGDLVTVADAGLPVPAEVETVDLLWRTGEPPFLPVLEAVLDECVVEHATLASELTDSATRSGLTKLLDNIAVEHVPHEELKAMSRRARVVVRTGATTPYANVVLRCGVAF
ncbi:MAG: D-ribose pyranase [Streptosporangiales bacterium]|nr:D-ribose pyranase [Streptosporangiales bacterium]